MEPASDNDAAAIGFSHFLLSPHRRELLAGGQPVKLGDRAFDVLMVLIEARGSIVSRDTLMTRVWSGQVVAENNLEVQISALRSVFGAQRALIRTVSRRGYRFTGELRFPAEAGKTPVKNPPGTAASSTNLPQPVSELIGRDDVLSQILRLAGTQRLVTLTGAGGIGKSRLALAAAHGLAPRFADGVWLIELAPVADPGLVPAVVAATVGLELAAGPANAERVANALNGRALLLVLDNCEHLITAAATMSEALLRANPAARVIATSREPLRAEGEQIYRVPSLAVPAVDIGDEADLLEYGAVRLFVERARAAEPQFFPDERRIAALAAICRSLDGIPLAIELAAARAAALGVEELAARLDERLNLLTGGRRTALPRHQTLRATLDWSHALLAAPERVLFRRLAIFAGWFSLGAVAAVAAGPELPAADTINGISSLAAKSLVAAEVLGVARYRLLETTRAYALEKLYESDERETIARRHAEHYRDLFERAEAEWEIRSSAEWIGEFGWRLDNLRAALDWAFSANGDARVGVALTAAAIPLWLQLSRLEECRDRVEQALAAVDAGAGRDARREMKLWAALGGSLLFTSGAMRQIEPAWTKALALAEGLDDPEYQLRALWGLWVHRMHSGDFDLGLEMAQRFRRLALAKSNSSDLAIGDRMVGVSLHYCGDQVGARRHIEQMLDHYVDPARRSPSARFVYDQRAIARVALARILWVQGFPEQAWSIVQGSVAEALALNNPFYLCFTLTEAACPVAFLIGDLVAAERYVKLLLDRASEHELQTWRSWGRRFQATLLIRKGDLASGLQLLRTSLDELPDADFHPRFAWLLAQLAQGLGRAGQVVEGIATIDEAIVRSARNGDRWYLGELLRIKGDLALAESASRAVAERLFSQALDVAREQSALSFELRAATSLAGLLRDLDRSHEALACLRRAYDRFTEGFDTADLRRAASVLNSL